MKLMLVKKASGSGEGFWNVRKVDLEEISTYVHLHVTQCIASGRLEDTELLCGIGLFRSPAASIRDMAPIHTVCVLCHRRSSIRCSYPDSIDLMVIQVKWHN